MKNKLEKDIEEEWARWAAINFDIWATRLKFENRKGWPDRIAFGPNGLIFFMEFKRTAKDQMSAQQIRVKEQLESKGQRFYCPKSLAEAKQITLMEIEKHGVDPT